MQVRLLWAARLHVMLFGPAAIENYIDANTPHKNHTNKDATFPVLGSVPSVKKLSL
jgi:hypothetical protein